MKTNTVNITPIFGHGWFHKGVPFSDVPPPFELREIEIVQNDKNFQILYGRVRAAGHLFNGDHVLLIHRGQWSTGHAFELFAQKETYDLDKLEISARSPGGETLGFAMINRDQLAMLI